MHTPGAWTTQVKWMRLIPGGHMKSAIAICCAVLFAPPLAAAQGGAGAMGKDLKPTGAITMVGCVAAGADGQFSLTNATIPAVPGQSNEGVKPATYDLVGGQLKPHVGHKVEVSGSMAADAPGKTQKTKTAAGARDSITVKSVKMLSTSCT
jgi:hypothetical protein